MLGLAEPPTLINLLTYCIKEVSLYVQYIRMSTKIQKKSKIFQNFSDFPTISGNITGISVQIKREPKLP